MTELTEDELDVLVRTVHGEARGELPEGKAAVVHVIRNRVQRPGWWGRDIVSVCKHPWQFACWNEGDLNREIIERLPRESEVYQRTAAIVRRAWKEPDVTLGADHYYAPAGMPGGRPPAWAAKYRMTVALGRHLFFSSVTNAPPREPETVAAAARTDTGRGAITLGAIGAAVAAAGPLVAELAKMPPLTMAALGATIVALAALGVLIWRSKRT